jgi:3-oxoacyl-[acyl-carrier-protein] synthase II
MSERRVVVTGVGAINASGVGAAAIHESVCNGRASLKPIARFSTVDFPIKIGGEVQSFRAEDYVPKRLITKSDRFTHFALAASAMAVEEAQLDLAKEDLSRFGVWFGNDTGGWDLAERGFLELYREGAKMVNPWGATAWFPTAPQGFTTIRYGITGVSKSFVCDRASGAAALYFAWRAIRAGQVDAVLAGGTEAPFTALGVTCYHATGELSTSAEPDHAYLPFDRARQGLVLGEGSAVLVLEEESRARKRGAVILGEFIGASMTTDPNPKDSDGYARAMAQAMKRARVKAQDIDVVFAEGAGAQEGDAVEARALGDAFEGTRALVTCPKGAYGHLFGASGATEAVLGIMAMKTGSVPPVVGLRESDISTAPMPTFVRESRARATSTVIVNARGREGVNVSLVIGRARAGGEA